MTTGNLYVYKEDETYLVVEDHGDTHDLFWFHRGKIYPEIPKSPYEEDFFLTPEEWTDQ